MRVKHYALHGRQMHTIHTLYAHENSVDNYVENLFFILFLLCMIHPLSFSFSPLTKPLHLL